MYTTLEELERVLKGREAKPSPLDLESDPADRDAAVYVLFGGPAHNPDLILIRRARNSSRHRTEWALPGGLPEPPDKTLRETALREAVEELGVQPRDIRHWGALDPEITRTGFVVWPFTGMLQSPDELNTSSEEIDDVVNAPIAALAMPSSARTISMLENGHIRTVPAYAYNGRIIWGATARIIGQALQAANIA